MDAHFLDNQVKGKPRFSAEPWYNPHGDCITCLIANEAEVADRIDGILTIYRSAIDDRPIGFQLKGVSSLLRNFGADALAVQSKTANCGTERQLISVSALLLAAYEEGPKTVGRRSAYSSIMGEPAMSCSLPKGELVPA